MNVARKVSLENGSNSFSASWCASWCERENVFFRFLKLEIHFLSFFFCTFFFFGNLQYHFPLDNVTNVSEFPKEALEGSPL